MMCNQEGLNLICQFEGLRLQSYQDERGIWTLGYGETQGITKGMTCTPAQALDWLTNTVNNVSESLTRMIKVPVNENQFSALVSLAYNIGLGNFSNSSALATLNTGAYDDVPPHISLWDEINGEANLGLIRRRAAEVALYLEPV